MEGIFLQCRSGPFFTRKNVFYYASYPSVHIEDSEHDGIEIIQIFAAKNSPPLTVDNSTNSIDSDADIIRFLHL